jgi:hypothetical protein
LRSSFITTSDLNEDGYADLLVTDDDRAQISLLFNKGDGTFFAARSYAVGPSPSFIAVGDFNEDTHADLAVANGGGVRILLNRRNGTFFPAVAYAPGGGTVVVADFNEDGHADLASGTSVMLGNGDGTFRAAIDSASSGTNAVADFNADGHADLTGLNGFGVSVALGKGDGTFYDAVSSYAGDLLQSLAVADFNGDGRADVVVTYAGLAFVGGASVLVGKGDGTFSSPVSYTLVSSLPLSVTTADFNRDGHVDFAVVDNVRVTVLLYTGCQ